MHEPVDSGDPVHRRSVLRILLWSESVRIGSPAVSAITRRQFGAANSRDGAGLTRPFAKSAPPVLKPLAKQGGTAFAAIAGVTKGASGEAVVDAVRRAALQASDFSWRSRGDRVLIKTVCNSGGGYPFTTDPVSLRAMIRLLRERGAGKVIVADMSGV